MQWVTASSENAGETSPATTPTLATTDAGSNCIGGIYQFKPHKEWSLDTQREVERDWMYQRHPVVVLQQNSDGPVHIVTITSHIDLKLDPRLYVPISAQNFGVHPRICLAEGEAGTCELPIPRSYVRLDSRRQIPLEALQEFHKHDKSQYQLTGESTTMLWESVMEFERGFVSHQEWEYQQTQKRVSSAVSNYVNSWSVVDKCQKRILSLDEVRGKVRKIADLIDEFLDEEESQTQPELQLDLHKNEVTPRNTVLEQLDDGFLKSAQTKQKNLREMEIVIATMREMVKQSERDDVTDVEKEPWSKEHKALRNAIRKVVKQVIKIEKKQEKMRTKATLVENFPEPLMSTSGHRVSGSTEEAKKKNNIGDIQMETMKLESKMEAAQEVQDAIIEHTDNGEGIDGGITRTAATKKIQPKGGVMKPKKVKPRHRKRNSNGLGTYKML